MAAAMPLRLSDEPPRLDQLTARVKSVPEMSDTIARPDENSRSRSSRGRAPLPSVSSSSVASISWRSCVELPQEALRKSPRRSLTVPLQEVRADEPLDCELIARLDP